MLLPFRDYKVFSDAHVAEFCLSSLLILKRQSLLQPLFLTKHKYYIMPLAPFTGRLLTSCVLCSDR